MKHVRLWMGGTLLSSFFLMQAAYSAAFELYELGTPIIGTAGVGQAAVADDASTTYFNPAGMAKLNHSQFLLGSQMVLPYTIFSPNRQNTLSGDNGGNAAALIPGIGMYYVYRCSPKLRFGVSLTSPYGGVLNYNQGWVGRYIVQDMQFYTLNLNPTVAYKFNDWVAIGGGVAIEYANLHETVAIPILGAIDGQGNIKVDNTAAGFNLGILLSPNDSTKLGLAYRSKISHDLHGNTTFLRIGATPSTSTRMVMPQNVMLSLVQDLTCQFTLLGELGWANWASMRDTVVNIAGFSATTPRDWNNTYRVGLGGHYKLNSAWLLKAGVSYDSSPTDSQHRQPDLPMDRQVRVGAGVAYSPIKPVKLGFSYEYINFGDANIYNASSTGILAGFYPRNYANVVQASINVDV